MIPLLKLTLVGLTMSSVSLVIIVFVDFYLEFASQSIILSVVTYTLPNEDKKLIK